MSNAAPSVALPGDGVNAILEALAAVLPKREGALALHEPHFGEEEIALVTDCVRSGWVSSVGAYVSGFEEALAAYTGAKYAVACVNGTAALHIAYKLAGVQGGDEVLCPSLTFIATANALSYAGAVPHFVEVDPARLGVCPVRLRKHLEAIGERRGGALYNRNTGARIAALVVMHTFGHPADMPGLAALAEEFGLALVEDAAESLGATLSGRHTGTFGLVGTLSFNGNKIITTGGGGAILTDDAELARMAKHLTTTAKQPHAYEFIHDEVGYNYRLPNINAALGVAQLKKLPEFLAGKRRLAEAYRAALADIPGVKFIAEPPGARSNYWLNAVQVENQETRDALLAATHARRWLTRPLWRPMHLLPIYANCPRMALAETERLYETIVNLPSSYGLA